MIVWLQGLLYNWVFLSFVLLLHLTVNNTVNVFFLLQFMLYCVIIDIGNILSINSQEESENKLWFNHQISLRRLN